MLFLSEFSHLLLTSSLLERFLVFFYLNSVLQFLLVSIFFSRRLEELAAEKTGQSGAITWYIMTSGMATQNFRSSGLVVILATFRLAGYWQHFG